MADVRLRRPIASGVARLHGRQRVERRIEGPLARTVIDQTRVPPARLTQSLLLRTLLDLYQEV
jgi:hypothetical protein